MTGMGGANQIASLFVKIGADARQFENAMGGVDRRLGNTRAAITKFGAVVGAVAVGSVVAIGAGLTSALRASSEFDKVISGAGAVLNATSEEMEKLSDAALRIGKDTAFSAGEAAGAIEMLAKNGLSFSEIMGGAADATVALAAATGTDLKNSADIATDAMAIFGIDAGDMTQAINGVSAVMVNSKFDMNDYALALGNMGPKMAMAGVSFEEFNAIQSSTASFFKSGMTQGSAFNAFIDLLTPSTEGAAAGLRKLGIFSGLTSSGFEAAQEKVAKYQKRLEALDPTSKNFAKKQAELTSNIDILTHSLVAGQNAFFDTEGNLKSMAEVFGILQDATRNLNKEDMMVTLESIFGRDGAEAAFAAITVGHDGFIDAMTKNAAVNATEQAARRLDNLAGDVEQLSGSFETLRITIGKAFTPLARKGMQFLTKQINKLLDMDFGKWAEMASEGIDSFGKASKAAIGIIARLWDGFKRIRETAADFLRPFAGPLKALVEQFKAGFASGFGNMNLAGPLQGLFSALVDTWLSMQRWMLGTALPAILTTVAEWGAALVGWIAPQVPGILTELGSMFAELFDWIVSQVPALKTKLGEWAGAFMEWAGSLWPGIRENLKELWGALTEWVTNPSKQSELASSLKDKWTGFTEWAGSVWKENIAPKLSELWGALTEWVTNPTKRAELASNLKDKWTGFTEWAGSVWKENIAPPLGTAYKAIKNWIADPAKRQETLNSLKEKWTAFSGWAEGIWKENIAPPLGTAYKAIKNWIADPAKRAETFQNLKDKWTQFTDWAQKVWTWAEPQLAEMYADMNEWIRENVPQLQPWKTAFDEFFSGMSSQFQLELPFLETRWIKFQKTLVAELDRIGKAFGGTFGPGGSMVFFGEFFAKTIVTIGNIFFTLIESMIIKLRVLAESFKALVEIGKALAKGDMAGAAAGLAQLGVAISGFADMWKAWRDLIESTMSQFGATPNGEPTPPPGGWFGGTSGTSFFGTGLSAATVGSGGGGTININISGDGAALPNDRAKLRDLARAIWREAEMSGMRL